MDTSSAFLAIPLEIRQQIYRFCIPQNLRFNCLGDIYRQSRPERWVEPPWHLDRIRNAIDGTYFSSKENDCPYCSWETSEAPLTVIADNDEDGEGQYGLSGLGDDDDDDDEYEPSRLSGEGDEHSLTGFDDYCFMCNRYRQGDPASRQSALPGILLVCRQMTEEVETMLYGGNTFTVNVHGNGQLDLVRFSPKRREKMRKMILVLRPMGVSYRPAFRMDPEIWDSVLGNLVILGVVAEQPEPLPPYSWPQVERDDVFEEWGAWLTPILEYLSRILPSTTQVVVDANEEERTIQMIAKVMPGRCSFQQLRMANFIFRRGEFSLESGYWDDDGPTSCRDIINDSDYEYYYSD